MKNKNAIIAWLTASSIIIGCACIADDAGSPLTQPQQSAAKRGNSYARSGKADKTQSAYQTAIDQAVSVEQCLALTKNTEHFGSIISPVRRNCLVKALSLAKTDDDYFQIIIAARQCQFYEITKQCIDALIARAKTKDELLTLAHKAQSMASNDVAHIAMEKLYGLEENNTDKFAFAKQAKLMAMEDLTRKAIKDMLDQEQTTHGLCIMAIALDPLEVPDLQRKILRKAVYQVTNIADCKEIYETARRYSQQDIVDLAGYKGRKMMLMQQASVEQDAIKEQQEALQEQAIEAQMSAEEKQEYEAKKAAEAQDAQANKNAQPKQPTGPGF